MLYFIIGFLLVGFLFANPIIFWVLLGIIVLCYIIYKIYANSNVGKEAKQKHEAQLKEKQENFTKYLNDLGVFPTKIIKFDFWERPIIYIDDNNGKLFIQNVSKNYVISYNQIMDFELKVDDVSQYKYTLNTALTGKFQTTNKVNNISVFIYLNDINVPYIEINTLGGCLNTNVFDGQKFADELIATLKYIKHNTTTIDNNTNTNINTNINNNSNNNTYENQIKSEIDLIKEQTAAIYEQIEALKLKQELEKQLKENKDEN